MKLVELEPVFVRFETRVETWTRCIGSDWKHGDPVEHVTGPREYSIRVSTLAEAQGIRFLCPACFTKNGGPVGTHGVEVAFHEREVLPNQGSHGSDGGPSRWHVAGDSFDNLTLTPSIDGGCWHGYVTHGEIR